MRVYTHVPSFLLPAPTSSSTTDVDIYTHTYLHRLEELVRLLEFVSTHECLELRNILAHVLHSPSRLPLKPRVRVCGEKQRNGGALRVREGVCDRGECVREGREEERGGREENAAEE